MKNENIGVIMQAFYGNRTFTELSEDNIDYFLQGTLDKNLGLDYEIDRTIIAIPYSKCVIVYNKHQEVAQRKQNEEWKQQNGYIAKPLAIIPEQGIEIYSRCFICRMNEAGALESIQNEDAEFVNKYFAL